MLFLKNIYKRGAIDLAVKKIKCVVHKLAGRVLSDLPDSSNDLRLRMASEMSN